jgi:DNA-binding transcriptional ArsR family regulator
MNVNSGFAAAVDVVVAQAKEDARAEVLALLRDRSRWSQPQTMEQAADAIESELGERP